MKTNIVVDISPPVPYVAKFWFPTYGPKCCWSVKSQDSLKRNKEANDEAYFWHAFGYV